MGINITIKDLPEEIGAILKANAKANHRSMNAEIKNILEKSIITQQRSPEERLEKVRKFRSQFPKVSISDDEISAWKIEGRK